MKLALLTLSIAACGSKAPAAESTTPTPTAHAALPDVPFDKLDHAQQKQFMGEKVMPVLKPIFQHHNAKDFEKFECATCHGKGAEKDAFDMPNPELPKLTFADMSKFKKEDIEWMKTEVEPTMAKILNLPMYSPENPTGFGCLACHTQAGS
jgi:hypothetical protein